MCVRVVVVAGAVGAGGGGVVRLCLPLTPAHAPFPGVGQHKHDVVGGHEVGHGCHSLHHPLPLRSRGGRVAGHWNA
jgi:hypothetical protein